MSNPDMVFRFRFDEHDMKGEHQNCIVKRRWQAFVNQTWTWNFPKASSNRNLLSAKHHHSERFLCSL
jgi:hypothetical protein